MVASGRKHQAARPFEAAVVVAVTLLVAAAAHPSSVHASSTGGRSPPPSSPCVRITSAALSSSCLPGADVEYFTFAMEGTAGADNAHHYRDDLDTEDGASSATIAARAGESVVPCTATDVTVTVGFAAPVISVAYPWGATISGASMVTFFVETLGANPTEFAVSLDTTGIAVGTNVVTYASYSDNEGNFPAMSGLMAVASATPECGRYAAAVAPATEVVRRKLQDKKGEDPYDDCDLCANLTSAQLEALDMYDNGGKVIVCDPTCLDGVSDPTHCNYFGLGQICRGCGDCSTCSPCPDPDKTPAPTPNLTEPPTSTGPPSTRVVENDDGGDDDSDSDDGDGDVDDDSDSDSDSDDGDGDVDDDSGSDSDSDDGDGDVDDDSDSDSDSDGGDVDDDSGSGSDSDSDDGDVDDDPDSDDGDVDDDDPDSEDGDGDSDDGDDDDDDDSDDVTEYDCTPCTGLSDDQLEALTMYDRGGKKIVCDPTCLDGVSDPTHCNYFGLGQICRGCGTCPTCTPCP